MENYKSLFASMSFAELSEKYGIEKSEPEQKSEQPATLLPDISLSILQVTGQQFGDAINGESSAK